MDAFPEQIRVVSARYLLAKPELAELPLPESPAIDEWGTMRLGVWILDSDGGELRLEHRTAETNVSTVRQELVLARTSGGWGVVRNAEVIYHRLRPRGQRAGSLGTQRRCSALT